MLIREIILNSNDDICTLSNSDFANNMGMSASGVSKIIKRLTDLGYIERTVHKEAGNDREIKLTKDFFNKILK